MEVTIFQHFYISIIEETNDKVQRWNLSKADWHEFKITCQSELNPDKFNNLAGNMETFTSTLYDIAKMTIPKTSTNPKRLNKPWWNHECQVALINRRKALSRFKRQPTQEHLIEFRKAYARAKGVFRRSMKTSWHNYVSKLNNRTPVKKTWEMIRKITGKGQYSGFKHLEKNGNMITNTKDIANTLAETISEHSSSKNYTNTFQRHKHQIEQRPLNFNFNNNERYNNPFTLRELEDSLHKSHDTAAGPDNIHYQILKHMPLASLQALLNIYNKIWDTGEFPPGWREATIIPIPKPGKDHTNPQIIAQLPLPVAFAKLWNELLTTDWYGIWKQMPYSQHIRVVLGKIDQLLIN